VRKSSDLRCIIESFQAYLCLTMERAALHISRLDISSAPFRMLFLLPILLAMKTSFGLPEGTRQLEPIDAPTHSFCRLSLTNNEDDYRIPFALLNCAEEYRLNVTVRDHTAEVIYIGFGMVTDYVDETLAYDDVKYQVRDPAGNIVSGFSLRQLPADPTDEGFIMTREQANAGPNINNTNPDGYQPLVLEPSANGDYVIEFEIPPMGQTDARVLKYFDVTVASGNTPRTGRLWSKAWQFSSAAVEADEKASFSIFYIYSNDSIVTRFDCNGLAGGIWAMVSNEWGTSTTGDWNERRKSVSGNATVMPQYKIFLNDPDIQIFPTGRIGELIDFQMISSDCDTAITFAANVSKPGHIEILLDLEPLNPGSVGTEDVQLGYAVLSGYNLLTPPWDGKNRQGIPVPNGSLAEARIKFLNGLTNIPLFDVEDNPSGFKVDMKRPMPGTGSTKLKIFWDDTAITGATPQGSNTSDGCVYPDIPPVDGCHDWMINDGTGNLNTINSWWYYSTNEHMTIPVSLKFSPPSGKLSGPSAVCSGQSGVFRTEKIPFAHTYHWRMEGPGVYEEYQTNAPDTVYSFLFGTALSAGIYKVYVYGNSPVCGNGPETSISCFVYLNEPPPVTGPSELCMHTAGQFTLPGSYSAITWHPGRGQITGSPGTNTVSLQWPSAGPDTIRVSALSPECGWLSSSIPVNILPVVAPLFSTNDWNTGCRDHELRFNDHSGQGQGMIVQRKWDWGDGTSTAGNLIAVSHTYSTTGNKTVTLSLTTQDGCTSSLSQVIRIVEPPTAAFSYYRNCIQDSLQLVDLTTGPDINSWHWQIESDQAATNQMDQQVPVAMINTAGPVRIQLVAGNQYGCADTLSRWIRFHPSPEAAFSHGLVCEDAVVEFLDQSTPADTTLEWFHWKVISPEDEKQVTEGPMPGIVFSEPSLYRLEYTVTDNFGCRDTEISDIQVNQKPSGNFIISENSSREKGHLIFINVSEGAVTYSWDFGNGETSSAFNTESHYFEEGNYLVCLSAWNSIGCIDTSCMYYRHTPGLLFPSAFSPDYDGHNDVFRPVTYRNTLEPYLLVIYNPWGQVVFRTMNPEEGWDGRYRGEDCPGGQYIYYVQYRGNGEISSDLEKRHGSFTLVR